MSEYGSPLLYYVQKCHHGADLLEFGANLPFPVQSAGRPAGSRCFFSNAVYGPLISLLTLRAYYYRLRGRGDDGGGGSSGGGAQQEVLGRVLRGYMRSADGARRAHHPAPQVQRKAAGGHHQRVLRTCVSQHCVVRRPPPVARHHPAAPRRCYALLAAGCCFVATRTASAKLA